MSEVEEGALVSGRACRYPRQKQEHLKSNLIWPWLVVMGLALEEAIGNTVGRFTGFRPNNLIPLAVFLLIWIRFTLGNIRLLEVEAHNLMTEGVTGILESRWGQVRSIGILLIDAGFVYGLAVHVGWSLTSIENLVRTYFWLAVVDLVRILSMHWDLVFTAPGASDDEDNMYIGNQAVHKWLFINLAFVAIAILVYWQKDFVLEGNVKMFGQLLEIWLPVMLVAIVAVSFFDLVWVRRLYFPNNAQEAEGWFSGE